MNVMHVIDILKLNIILSYTWAGCTPADCAAAKSSKLNYARYMKALANIEMTSEITLAYIRIYPMTLIYFGIYV